MGLATLFIYLIIPGIWMMLMVIAEANLSKGGVNALNDFKLGTTNATNQGVQTTKNAITRGRL